MTKGEKKFLITTGIIFLAGLIIIIIGILAGGVKQGMSFAKDIGTGAMKLAGNMTGYGNSEEFKNAVDPFQTLDFDLEEIPTEGFEITDFDRFDMNDVDEVYVLAKAGDINISEANSDKYGVEIEGKALRYFMRDDAIYVTADAIDGTVYIPKNEEYVKLTVATTAGDIEISTHVKFDDFNLNAAAGNVEIASLNADNSEFTLGAGNLELNDMNVNSVKVSSIFGNIEMAGSVSEKAIITGIGNIELQLAGIEGDYNYDLSAGAGKITIGTSNWNGTSLDKKIDNSAACDVIAATKSGNIEISFK